MPTRSRVPLRKSMRFAIFKRDLFTCQYCGAQPPAVTLEVDHVIPLCKGGSNSEINLITSCFDCNRGKGRKKLDDALPPVGDRNAVLREREEQIKEYEKLVRSRKRRETKLLDEILEIYEGKTGRKGMPMRFANTIRYQFMPKLPSDFIVEAMHIACDRMHSETRIVRYFCGICWKTIKEQSKEKQP